MKHVSSSDPIAIVGLSCKFPGAASDLEGFWDVLSSGVDTLSPIPSERWNIDQFYSSDPDAPGKMFVQSAGFLKKSIALFDPSFFGISPREAELMDPQQRLLLETTWEAFENAGIKPSSLAKSLTGVFIGATTHEFADILHRLPSDHHSTSYYGTGTSMASLAGRLSYFLGLEGPCMTIDTACSSSLVGIDLAKQKLQSGECEVCIVGGVNAIVDPNFTVKLCKAKMLSPTSRCHTFSADADGYARGEGCGVIVLKRLSDAQRDGDRVLALIRGSAVNQDGASGGLTVPNGPAQVKVSILFVTLSLIFLISFFLFCFSPRFF